MTNRPSIRALILIILSTSAASAQTDVTELQQHANQPTSAAIVPQAGPHGGTLKQLHELQLETVVTSTGIQIFAFDGRGHSLPVQQARGTVSVFVEGNAKRYRYDLLPDGKGGLSALVNLSPWAGRQIDLDIQLVGLSQTSSRPVRLNEVAAVPLSEAQRIAAANRGGESITVQQRSSGGTVPAGTEAAGDGVFKVTSADQPFIVAQQNCPVMNSPLHAMGGPYKTSANGRAIYICCPGCAKRIADDPHKYISLLKEQGITPPVQQPTRVPAL